MSNINLTNKQIQFIAAYIEEEEREIYPDEKDMAYIGCVDDMIRDSIEAWNGGGCRNTIKTL
tara:strand:+ start:1065 stop:1250 length:186 start_codon:yes stop_codon:yes gene_type:complete